MYNPQNHFWIVAGDKARVFSSAAGDYVPTDNPQYVLWLTIADNLPTHIASDQDLRDVMAGIKRAALKAKLHDAILDVRADAVQAGQIPADDPVLSKAVAKIAPVAADVKAG